MFQFPSFPSCNYVFIAGSQALRLRGSPIRISADRSLFAAPRSFSQLITSFVGSWCQGIHLMLFLAWTSLFCSPYCLSFANNFLQWKSYFNNFLLLGFSACVSTCGQIVVFHDFQKDLQFISNLNLFFNPVKLSVRFSYLVFNEHSFRKSLRDFRGGLKWSRTPDLMLIRHAL